MYILPIRNRIVCVFACVTDGRVAPLACACTRIGGERSVLYSYLLSLLPPPPFEVESLGALKLTILSRLTAWWPPGSASFQAPHPPPRHRTCRFELPGLAFTWLVGLWTQVFLLACSTHWAISVTPPNRFYRPSRGGGSSFKRQGNTALFCSWLSTSVQVSIISKLHLLQSGLVQGSLAEGQWTKSPP